jgi:hypothetical protein
VVKQELCDVVNSILISWRDGTSDWERYAAGDTHFSNKPVSPTEWQIKLVDLQSSEALVTVFIKSSNKLGMPIQRNYMFSLKKVDGEWKAELLYKTRNTKRLKQDASSKSTR